MRMPDQKEQDVLHRIETALRREYEAHPGLSDSICVFALDSAKIAVKKEFGFARNERLVVVEGTQGIVDACVAIGVERIGKVDDLTLQEYLICLDIVPKSVIRHAQQGRRAYFEFIKDYV